jgi:hypothetical protein
MIPWPRACQLGLKNDSGALHVANSIPKLLAFRLKSSDADLGSKRLQLESGGSAVLHSIAEKKCLLTTPSLLSRATRSLVSALRAGHPPAMWVRRQSSHDPSTSLGMTAEEEESKAPGAKPAPGAPADRSEDQNQIPHPCTTRKDGAPAPGFCHCREKAIVSAHARSMETAHRERPGNSPWKTADQGNTHPRRPRVGLLGRRQDFRRHFG